MTASSHSRHSINLLRHPRRGVDQGISGLSVEVRSAARTVIGNQLHDRRAALAAESPCRNPTTGAVAIFVIEGSPAIAARYDVGIMCGLQRSLYVFEITHHRVVSAPVRPLSLWSTQTVWEIWRIRHTIRPDLPYTSADRRR